MTTVLVRRKSAEEAARQLNSRNYRKESDGFMTSCPVPGHGAGRGDLKPSLWLRDADDGGLVFKCYGNCDSRTVMDHLIRHDILEARDDAQYRPKSPSGAKETSAKKPSSSRWNEAEWEPVPLDTKDAPPQSHEDVLVSWRILKRNGAGFLLLIKGKDGKVTGEVPVTNIFKYTACYQDGRPAKAEVRIEFGWQEKKGRPDKYIRPMTLWRHKVTGRLEWQFRDWKNARPIYGQERVKAGAVLVVHEGPPKADSGAEKIPQAAHIAWCGGAGAIANHDWSVAKNHVVVLFYDHDAAGKETIEKVRQAVTAAGATSFAAVRWRDGTKTGADIKDITADEAQVMFQEALARGQTRKEEPPSTETSDTPPKQDGPFEVTDEGVFYNYLKDGESYRDRICSRLDIVAVTHDEHGNGWGRVLHFKDLTGRPHEWAMPMSLAAGDGIDIKAELLDQGLIIEPFKGAGSLVVKYITFTHPSETWLSVSRTGWHNDHYIMPDQTFGAGERRIVLQRERGLKHNYRTKGTLDDWRYGISRLCAGNPYLAFGLCAAFAAPLLKVAGEQGGGIHFRGDSSSGKTTVLEVAGSAWGGGGANGYLVSWRTTDNGLEAIGEAHCDALLCLDEIGQADPKTVGPSAYMLGNGQGKLRASRSGTSRPTAEWRLLFLSNGEESLASKMTEVGARTHAGMEIRFADVPVPKLEKGGVVNCLHEFEKTADLINHLKREVKENYGTAIREFLRQLTKDDRVVISQKIAEAQSDFLGGDHVPKDAGGQVMRVAKRFALIAAAGELATDMGITGWSDDEATNAAVTCFKAWLHGRGNSGNSEDTTAIEQTCAFLEIHGASRFSHMTVKESGEEKGVEDWRVPNRAGYVRTRKEDGGTDYLLFRKVFRDEVCRGLDHQRVAALLIERGYMATDSCGKTTKPVHARSPYRDENGEMVTQSRFYVISDKIFTRG